MPEQMIPIMKPWMGEEGVSAEDAAARANERLALTQVMTANSIMSLRAIGRLDWKSFVERQSALERTLREDPAGVYAAMTYATLSLASITGDTSPV